MTEFRPPYIIETDDLLIRAPSLSDAPTLFKEMFSDADTVHDLPFARHTSVDHTREFIEESLCAWRTGTVIRWVLEDKRTSNIAGLIELRVTLPRIEIGVIISKRGGSRRRRTSLFALRKLIAWLIAQPAVYRLYAYCGVDGVSHSVMERLGFTFEGLVRNYEARPNRGLPAADSYLFSLTRPVENEP
jgi:ribosomal-protein-alanine N-acetyltransferase